MHTCAVRGSLWCVDGKSRVGFCDLTIDVTQFWVQGPGKDHCPARLPDSFHVLWQRLQSRSWRVRPCSTRLKRLQSVTGCYRMVGHPHGNRITCNQVIGSRFGDWSTWQRPREHVLRAGREHAYVIWAPVWTSRFKQSHRWLHYV